MARARVEAVEITPNQWIAQVEVAKAAQGIGLSPKCDTKCTLSVVWCVCGWNHLKYYRK